MVVAIIGILASLLLPTLANAKRTAVRTSCLSNLRQLSVATTMYAGESNGKLVSSWPLGKGPDPVNVDCWCPGWASITQPYDASYGPAPQFAATNVYALQQGKLWPYLGGPGVYRCPSDKRAVQGQPVVRSYSMNCWMNGRSDTDPTGRSNYRTPAKDGSLTFTLFRRENQIKQPSQMWVLIDEDESSINDSLFAVSMAEDRNGMYDMPSNRHGSKYCLSFADGHMDTIKMVAPRTDWNSPGDADWVRLKSMTTVPRQ